MIWGLLTLISLIGNLPQTDETPPNIIIITIDTLRADRLPSYGYHRNTAPNLEKLIARGVRFTHHYTPEPLTAPAMATMLTARHPHEHGATRNGITIFEDLSSLPKTLTRHGYRTAAFVGNWTLRSRLSGLGPHFDDYLEIVSRKRWFGMFLSEATAKDITDDALTWLKKRNNQPFAMWLHYVEPHAPYRLHSKYLDQLGLKKSGGQYTRSERYDTEIAFCDEQIGRFFEGLEKVSPLEKTIIIFTADHGESLGEHGYWGHGRNLYQPSLKVPMAIIWPEAIKPALIKSPSSLIDIPKTVLGLIGKQKPLDFDGYDWSSTLLHNQMPPANRKLYFQAHRGAAQTRKGADRLRRRGLLELGMIDGEFKELLRVRNTTRKLHNLINDPDELNSLCDKRSAVTEGFRRWALEVEQALNRMPASTTDLSSQDIEMLRSLGYIE